MFISCYFIKIFRFFLVCSCLNAVSAYAEILSNHEAPNYTETSSCKTAFTQFKQQNRTVAFTPLDNTAQNGDPDSLKLLSWNIEKGKNAGWENDLALFAKQADFVLLQEAVLFDEMQTPNEHDIFWSFSQGYTTSRYTSGIMIASQNAPLFTCTLKVTEPWLRSPKSSLISFFKQKGSSPLAVVNLHAINFTFGVKDFTAQLAKLEDILQQHNGPLIVAGDFNTWNQSRFAVLKQFSNALNLQEVAFSPDARTHKFGRALDYVFVRQLDVASTQVQHVNSSDHNPLSAVLGASL